MGRQHPTFHPISRSGREGDEDGYLSVDLRCVHPENETDPPEITLEFEGDIRGRAWLTFDEAHNLLRDLKAAVKQLAEDPT